MFNKTGEFSNPENERESGRSLSDEVTVSREPLRKTIAAKAVRRTETVMSCEPGYLPVLCDEKLPSKASAQIRRIFQNGLLACTKRSRSFFMLSWTSRTTLLYDGGTQMKKRTQLLAMFLAGAVMMAPANVFADETETETATEVATEAASEDAESVFPFTLVTKDDQEVTFTHVPERVISTNPNTGEELMALGLGDKIIGTCYNNAQLPEQYREEYESKPKISDDNGYPSLEVVLDLDPDFIYGRSSAFSDKDTAIATHDTLSSYGIMSLSSIEGYKLGCDVEDVYQDFYNLGKIFQVEDKANEVVDGMKEKIAEVESKIEGTDEVKVFNFDCDMDGGAYTPGNNFTSKLIRHAGGVNVFEDLEKTWNTVSWEAVVEADPDIIVINDYGETTADEKIQALKDNEALSDVTAIKNENFLVITLPEVFASTRVADTIEKFAEAFHPECFE